LILRRIGPSMPERARRIDKDATAQILPIEVSVMVHVIPIRRPIM
jgi:hypothetical protein